MQKGMLISPHNHTPANLGCFFQILPRSHFHHKYPLYADKALDKGADVSLKESVWQCVTDNNYNILAYFPYYRGGNMFWPNLYKNTGAAICFINETIK